MQPLPKPISIQFRFRVFMCMLMVVYIHAYNLNARYLQPWSVPNEPLTPTSFTEYFFSNGIFRFVIPMLFLISGYLYAMRDEVPYKQRIQKRLKVLLIPYLVWSAAGFLFVYILEMFPYTMALVANSHLVSLSNTRLLLHDYHWYEILARWILIPVPYQLWFICVLIVYNIAYPVLRWCMLHKTIRWIYFTVVICLWLTTFGTVLVEGEGLLFFSLGILLQKTNFNIETAPRPLNPFAWGIAFVVLCAGKTWLAFKGFSLMGNAVFPVLSMLHKLSIICGLITAWYGSSRLALWCMQRKWFVWLTGFSFIIYVVHAPAIAIAIDGVFAALHYINGYRILTYIFLPVVMIMISITIGVLLRWLSPKLYSIVTGGRGNS